MNTTINVLGTEYTVQILKRDEDTKLSESDGYCDWSTHSIVVVDIEVEEYTVGNPTLYVAKVLRHEIIHAFMYESGLHEHATFDDEHFEQMVDWIAFQYPKIKKVFDKLNI